MKYISRIQILILIVFFVSCSNHKKTTIEENKEDTIVLDTSECREWFMFAGLIGNDSVFTKSDTIEFDWQDNLVVYLGKEVLYRDTNRGFYKITPSNVKIIQLKSQKIAYILITKNDTPFDDKWFILKVCNRQVKETYTVIKEILEDLDNDGFFEIGGIELIDAVCLDCDSSYYRPFEIYKLNEKFEFDSIASKDFTMKLYGTFLGFDNYNVDTVLKVPK